jgi:hypothetical protein
MGRHDDMAGRTIPDCHAGLASIHTKGNRCRGKYSWKHLYPLNNGTTSTTIASTLQPTKASILSRKVCDFCSRWLPGCASTLAAEIEHSGEHGSGISFPSSKLPQNNRGAYQSAIDNVLSAGNRSVSGPYDKGFSNFSAFEALAYFSQHRRQHVRSKHQTK